MANYTSDEIQSVVDQLVRSSIRRPYDALGVRRTDVTFNDMQESAAGVLLLFPKSPFYLVYLAGQRLVEVMDGVGAALADLQAALRVLRKRSLPVRDVSALVNAKVALFELEGAVSSTKPPKDVTKVPAYVRFNSNVDRFLKAVGSNIKDGGQIVQTPEEARKVLPSLVATLKAQVEEMVRRAGLLKGALDDYNSLGLPQLLSKGVVSRARAMLSSRADQLSKMGDMERLTVIRSTVLELLGMKAVVTKFGSFAGLSSDPGVTGTLLPFSDSSRLATPASIELVCSAQLALVPGHDEASSTNILKVWIDGAPTSGAPSTTFYLPTSLYPKIEGLNPGPYKIVSNGDASNNSLNFLIDGATTITCALTVGNAQTAAQVAADLTFALSTHGFKGEAYFSPLMYDGQVSVSGNTLSLAFGAFPPSSVNVGDEVDFYFGPNATQTRTVTSVIVVSGAITGIVVDGAALTTSTTDRVQYGSANRRVRVVPINRTTAVVARRTIQVKMPTNIERDAGITLGMYGELYGKGQGTDAETVASYIHDNSSSIDATWNQVAVFTGTVQTDPGDSQGLLLSTPGLAVGMSVIVPEGVNAGKYFIDSIVSTTKVKLRAGMPTYRTGLNVGVSMDNVTIGFESYVVSSKNTTLASSVAVQGPLDSGSVSVLLGPVNGTTAYVTFPGATKKVSVGDTLEVYTVAVDSPSQVLTVTQVFADDVFQVSGTVPSNGSWPLVEGPLPFAKLITGHVADFDALSKAIAAALLLPGAVTKSFYEDLNRFVNPLLVNTNPTDSEISSAETKLLGVSDVTTAITTALNAYNPDHVAEMDQLIKAFKEKGADRALDMLLECRFSDFFGLSQEETSYAGNMQKAIRDVARLDLPVHRTNRLAQSISQLRSSAASTDYEIEHDDLDTSPQVDPPTEIDQTST